MPQRKEDLPAVVHKNCGNRTFQDFFVEISDDWVFKFDYAVRTSMTGDCILLALDKLPTWVYPLQYHLRIIAAAIKIPYGGVQITCEMNLRYFQKIPA